ncbi:putative membrane protein [Caulobacter ginsengisoli]|uniref:Membrane protein n=1 Tax=Caulobacter ginsengisoli TaxID=400775 RepID=A0ABU0ITY9_9CAUL|nr:DUF969 domain-containing protein [Caulobacter ginsengisoli]MDQ0464504.1 putative membrane protein [Caulobacter ginsengisoli]
MLVLLGVAVMVLGFALRLNPLAVVAAAAIVTGLAAGFDIVATLTVLGKAFRENRYISIVWLILPLIGLLEREGLQERARTLIGRMKSVTAGRLLLLYLLIRQITAALGLTSLGGQAQMVRPLIAPMAEGAAESRHGPLPDALRYRLRAFAAATDNVGLFFGEDIFIAIASILLIKGFFETNGIIVQPFDLSVWAIPTAIAALLIHGTRLILLDRRLAKDATPEMSK